ncbi:catalase [Sphingomonas sp. KRR8]|uniref:catalase n=1 Tax=Sphingomonas sp. KRR8 TaxID=2942996 RepID=UPI002021D3D4|nr:catalase [Sphingomonas sp. KRR8]URD60654.1 catalase [Sphingomonas sp. KRR8]
MSLRTVDPTLTPGARMPASAAGSDSGEDPTIAERLVDALARPDGSAALRPVHATGNGATGSFAPSDVAHKFCKASHFRRGCSPVRATVRFSNGSGCATRHDGWSDVRGMATRFHLADGSATDLIAMTLREFFAPDAYSFLRFAVAAKPRHFKSTSWLGKIWDYLNLRLPVRDAYPGEVIRPDEGAVAFANQHDYAQLAVFDAASIGAPVSYARASYHAVHTFVLTAPDGTRRYVRFSWLPTVGVLNTDPLAVPVDRYLERELHRRIAAGPVHFNLMMVLGEAGDDFDDSTRPWPPHRRRVFMGTLTLDKLLDDDICERLNFNPWLLPDGIGPSNDPVLRVRKEAYEISGRRRGAAACPCARRDDHAA